MRRAAIIVMPTILKKLQRTNKNKDMVTQRAFEIIYDLSKKYGTVIVPQIVIDELKSRSLLFFSTAYNIVSIDEIYHSGDNDTFGIAPTASEKFNCPVDIITCDSYFSKPRLLCTINVINITTK